MTGRCVASACFLLLSTWTISRAAAPLPPPDRDPILRVEAGGPTAFVTALAFSSDGKTLYAAGFDKVVRVWTLDENTHRFTLSSTAYRVPTAPGTGGVINCIALSPDGTWLAVAGRMVFRGETDYRATGYVLPTAGAVDTDRRLDVGTIYIFHTKTRAVRILRGHQGPVLTLAFAPTRAGKPSILASVGREEGSAAAGSVRLWNLDPNAKDPALAKFPGPLPDPYHADMDSMTRPGLALWHTGSGLRQVRVAIAWEDNRFRLWDVTQNDISPKNQPFYNNTAVYLPEQGAVLTGDSISRQGNSVGYLRTWAVGKDRELVGSDPVALPNAFPRALAALSGKATGQIDGAAVVLQIPADRAPSRRLEYTLQLLDLRTFRTIAAIPLWGGTADLPVLATAPNGRYLAVAGNPGHTIRLYAIADLLQNQAAPLQELRSAGTIMRSVAFVKSGKNRGLRLNEKPAGPGGLVYDFAKRTLTDNLQGWQTDAPPSAGEDIKPMVKKLGLKAAPKQIVAALLPAGTLVKVPLLAVAVNDNVETRLGLYNATTGEQLRQLSGHVNAILALAFSGDGKLLASASEDETVNVWSLADLDKTLDQEGQLRGVYVRAKPTGPKATLEIAEPDQARLLPDNRQRLAEKKVKKGDIVEGLVEGGKLRPLKSADEFYQAMRRLPPGKTVTLRIAGKGDVALTVSQGIDERKPLFSLFVTLDRQLKKWDWVGWSPVGPYDSSDRTVERLIGWHENKGTIEKPAVQFSLAEEYRRQYFKPGILRDLLDYGNPGQALDAWNRRLRQAREPHLSLGLQENGLALRPDAHGRLRVARPQVIATLALDQLPPEEVRSVEWRWNDQHGRFQPTGEREWSADLTPLRWQRGESTFQAEVRTGGPAAEVYSRQLTLIYQPPRPVVDIADNLPRFVRKPAYEVSARVTPGKGQTVVVKLEHWHGQELVGKPASVKAMAKTDIHRTTVQLKPGPNIIKIVATNQDAPPESAAAESAWRVIEVTYQATEPQITLAAVVHSDGTRTSIDPAHPDTAIGVDEAKVRIRGAITAQEALVMAQWSQEPAASKNLDQFHREQKPKQLVIDQPITLTEPGKPRKVRFVAQAANSRQAERWVTLTYQPKLPRVALQAPAPEAVVRATSDTARVPLRAVLTWPSDPHPCQADILVNGVKQGPPRAMGVQQKQLEADLDLEPGNNEIQVVLHNSWHRFATPKTLVIFRALPQVTALTQGQVANKPPRVTLKAAVTTAATRPLTRVEVHSWKALAEDRPPTRAEMSIRAIPPAVWKPQKGPRQTTWTIVAEDIPLVVGTNFVQFVASNQDGDTPEVKPLQVVYQKPAEPKARVRILEPATNTVVQAPRLRVHCVVQSRSPLTRVELVREGEAARDREVLMTLPGAAVPALGLTVDQAPEITLKRGLNTLYLIAANEGGEAISTPVVVNYQYVPLARLSLDQLEVGNRKYTAQGEPRAGILQFPPLPQGRAVLSGHVTWDAESDPRFQGSVYVRVFVNGHQLLPVTLEPAVGGQRRREFKVEVALNLARGNLIHVRLPARVVPEAGSQHGLLVDCREPLPRRAFAHLLILSQEKGAEEGVRRHVLESLRGVPQGKERFTMPGFSEGGQIYGPLIGEELTFPNLNQQLNSIRQRLALRAQTGSVNDVVMIYFRGAEKLTGRDHLFQTGPEGVAAPALPPGVSFTYLSDFFAKNQGAQIWLLDVTHPPEANARAAAEAAGADAVVGGRAPNLAAWRYTWTGPPRNQKPDARLITNLRAALARARNLGQLRDFLGTQFARPPGEKLPWESLSYPKKLRYDFYMAPGLLAWPVQP